MSHCHHGLQSKILLLFFLMDQFSTTAYFQLLLRFARVFKPDITPEELDQENGIVELTAEPFVVRFLPHLLYKTETSFEPDAVIVEVDLMRLYLEHHDVDHDHFLVLHQFNATSYRATGIMVFITDDLILALSKTVPLGALTEKGLAIEVGELLQTAHKLHEEWHYSTTPLESNH
ncbi:MAG: hypothetical protein NT164_02730 [Verrucomicrobiae bacterium]|nr:hypothetical protein [Verrucomicrobiae bacterium]